METTRFGERVLLKFIPVPMPNEIIQQSDVLALVGSVIDLANFVGEYTDL